MSWESTSDENWEWMTIKAQAQMLLNGNSYEHFVKNTRNISYFANSCNRDAAIEGPLEDGGRWGSRTAAQRDEAARERSREREGSGARENIISDLSGGSHLVKFSHHLEISSCPRAPSPPNPPPPKQLYTKCLRKSRSKLREQAREAKRRRAEERRGEGLLCDTSLWSPS